MKATHALYEQDGFLAYCIPSPHGGFVLRIISRTEAKEVRGMVTLPMHVATDILKNLLDWAAEGE